MNDYFVKNLEEAALNGYPASRQLLYDGWLLRFLGGPSKRVNSVNVLYPSSLPIPEKIAYCETVYEREGMPAIFRVPNPFSTEELNRALLGADYLHFDPTYVLGRKIENGLPGDIPKVEMRQMSITDWMQLRCYVGDVPVEKIAYLETILGIIVPEKALLGCFVDGKPAACGIAVREGALLGYFSIYTHHDERRKGYGRAVMAWLTDWGVKRGASFGYLQVEGHNTKAHAMYQAMGFETCYQYVYWKKNK